MSNETKNNNNNGNMAGSSGLNIADKIALFNETNTPKSQDADTKKQSVDKGNVINNQLQDNTSHKNVGVKPTGVGGLSFGKQDEPLNNIVVNVNKIQSDDVASDIDTDIAQTQKPLINRQVEDLSAGENYKSFAVNSVNNINDGDLNPTINKQINDSKNLPFDDIANNSNNVDIKLDRQKKPGLFDKLKQQRLQKQEEHLAKQQAKIIQKDNSVDNVGKKQDENNNLLTNTNDDELKDNLTANLADLQNITNEQKLSTNENNKRTSDLVNLKGKTYNDNIQYNSSAVSGALIRPNTRKKTELATGLFVNNNNKTESSEADINNLKDDNTKQEVYADVNYQSEGFKPNLEQRNKVSAKELEQRLNKLEKQQKVIEAETINQPVIERKNGLVTPSEVLPEIENEDEYQPSEGFVNNRINSRADGYNQSKIIDPNRTVRSYVKEQETNNKKLKQRLPMSAGVKAVIAICSVLAFIVALGGVYVAYLQAGYERLYDVKYISSAGTSVAQAKRIASGTTYTLVSYNLNYGIADESTSIYGYGGSSTRTDNLKVAEINTSSSANLLYSGLYNGANADFFLVQEMDTDSTRTFYHNQYQTFNNIFTGYTSFYATNLNSNYLLSPIAEPVGKISAGIATFSKYHSDYSVRRSLSSGNKFISKYSDYDNCIILNRLNATNGKKLSLINVYISPLESSDVKLLMLNDLLSIIKQEAVEYGNHIVVGGSFGYLLQQDALFNADKLPSYLNDIPEEFANNLAEIGCSIVNYNSQTISDEIGSMRDLSKVYKSHQCAEMIVDGFIVSSGIIVENIGINQENYLFSGHNPVYLQFKF